MTGAMYACVGRHETVECMLGESDVDLGNIHAESKMSSLTTCVRGNGQSTKGIVCTRSFSTWLMTDEPKYYHRGGTYSAHNNEWHSTISNVWCFDDSTEGGIQG